MIYHFRKELKKWKIVLWPVFLSFIAGSFGVLRYASQRNSLAVVNGIEISEKSFNSRARMLEGRANEMRGYARKSGMDPKFFLQIYGLSNPRKSAFDGCVADAIMQSAMGPLGVRINGDALSESLKKDLPQYIFNPDGSVNGQMYKQLLQTMGSTITDFEDKKESEMRRDLYKQFINSSYYTPEYVSRGELDKKRGSKNFDLYRISHDKAMRAVKNSEISEQEKAVFYNKNKERYRLPEKRSGLYWRIPGSAYEKNITVDDAAIERFYNRKKSSMFRIAPQVSVRVCEVSDQDQAENLRKEVSENGDLMHAHAKKHSVHSSASDGGLLSLFSRGTHGKELEKVAFRLKKVGDLSPVVKSSDGFLFVQLVERVNAQEKALSDVRDEIVSAITAKRALESIRADLALVRRNGKNGAGEEALARIINAADSAEDLVNVDKANRDQSPLKREVINLLYAISGDAGYNFGMHEGEYYLVSQSDRVRSKIPSLGEITELVLRDLQEERAKERVQSGEKQMRKAILSGDGSLIESVSSEYGVSRETLSGVTWQDRNEGTLGKVRGLGDAACALRASGQAATHADGNDLIILALTGISADKEATAISRQALDEQAEKDRSDNESVHERSFIASLHRSATIDVLKKIHVNPSN